jgi:hypothetical protein
MRGANVLSLTILDHIIVTRDEPPYYSMADRGTVHVPEMWARHRAQVMRHFPPAFALLRMGRAGGGHPMGAMPVALQTTQPPLNTKSTRTVLDLASTLRRQDGECEEDGSTYDGRRRRQNKSVFVRSLPSEMPAREVVEKAKAGGMGISVAYVYSIRAAAKTAARRSGRSLASRPGRRSSAGPSVGPVEDLLRALAAELGLSRAIGILQGEQAKVRAVLGM